MATLGNIRNRSGLLLSVIGIAMLAFILGDFMQSQRSGGSGSMYVGSVFGEEILRQTFEIKVEEGIENYKNQNPQAIVNQTLTAQIRNQIWDQYIRELIMNKEYQELGINVSDDEFFELLQGVNVHPEISKIPAFQNQQTGQFDRTKVLAYLQQIDQDQTGDAKIRWKKFENYLVDLIKNSKYNKLLSTAMFVTSEHAKAVLNEENEKIKLDFIQIPYNTIVDSLVEPTEKQIKSYYKNHEEEYQQEASCDVDYVAFNVVPSTQDEEKTKNDLVDLKSYFKDSEDYDLVVRRNSDNPNNIFSFISLQDISDINFKNLANQDKGSVVGPFLFSEQVYRLAKLVDIQFRSDSVEARHILIKPTEQVNQDSVDILIDNLKTQIDKGVGFDLLAQQYSEDQGSKIKGGDLGWFKEGVMVSEFNEACFASNIGELKVVNTQFGTHLIQVTQKSRKIKKVKIAYIDRNIEPSTETYNNYYAQAAMFASKILNEKINFDTLVVKENLVKRSDKKVKVTKENISGLPNSREMVRWIHQNDEGAISEVFQFDDSYVVAYLTKKYNEGLVPLSENTEQIRSLVLNENKYNRIAREYTSLDSLEKYKEKFGYEISTKEIVFSNNNIDGIGLAPNLVGVSFAIDNNITFGPIKGVNNAYLIKVISKQRNNEIVNDYVPKKNLMQKELGQISPSLSFNVLKEIANIEDNRFEFY